MYQLTFSRQNRHMQGGSVTVRRRRQQEEYMRFNLWSRSQSQTGGSVGLQGLCLGELCLPSLPHSLPKQHQAGTRLGPGGDQAGNIQTTTVGVYSLIDLSHTQENKSDIPDPSPILGVNQESLLFQHLILSLSGRRVSPSVPPWMPLSSSLSWSLSLTEASAPGAGEEACG